MYIYRQTDRQTERETEREREGEREREREGGGRDTTRHTTPNTHYKIRGVTTPRFPAWHVHTIDDEGLGCPQGRA